MQHKLNRKLLFWTLGSLLLCGVVIHLVHILQVRRNAGSLLANADRSMTQFARDREAGSLEHALTYYHHYLLFEPEDNAALEKFGLALEEQANIQPSNPWDRQRAVLKFEQVLRRDSSRKDLRFRLVNNLILLARFRDAIAHLQTLLPQWEDKAELEHILGWCQEAGGDYPRAAAAFARAIAADPRRVKSYVLLAGVLQNRLDRPEDADKVMDDLVKANDLTFQAYLIRSQFRQQQNHFAGAEMDLKKAQELAPKESAVLLAAADWAQSKGDLNKARELLQEGRKLDPRNVALSKALAGLEMRAGKHAAAVDVLSAALKEMPRAFELHVLLTNLLIDEGKFTDATVKINELGEAGFPTASDYLRARVAIGKGLWPEALPLLERARADLGTNSEWASRVQALLGQCYQQLGDHDQELEAFRRAVLQEPSWTLARFGLGAALVANGLLEEALTELHLIQNAADAPPELWSTLARALVTRNLGLPEKQRNWAEVEKALDRALEKTPKAIELPWLRAEVLAAQKQYAAAKDLLEKARAGQPDQMVFWAALADLAARQNQWLEANALLDRAAKNLGDGPELRLARCRIWGGEGSSAARTGLATLADNLDQFTPPARTRILRELADTWVRLGDAAKAETLWQRIAHEQPRDLRSRFALFENALHGNQEGKARTLLAELRRLEGEQGSYWRFAAAALVVHEAPRGDSINSQKLDETRKALDQLARRQKAWPRIPLLKARIEELEGRLEKAIDNYVRAVDLGDRQPHNLARLVQLLVHFQRPLEAEQVLVKVEEQMALPPELLRMGADLALANQNSREALRLAAQAVSPTGRDFRDCLWLGRIYHGAGEDSKAEEMLRKAVALAPHTPETWIALAELLTRMGKREAALVLVKQAKEKVAPRMALYTQARCYEGMGLVKQAEAVYRQALEQKAEDFILLSQAADFFRHTDQPEKAEPYLLALLKPASGAPPESVIRARRHLAYILAAKGQGNYQKALALIEGNLKSRPNHLADLRARAFLQATQPSLRRQAIRVFEDTAKRQPLSADEQLQLAQLFDAAGDQLRAREQIVALLTAQPENPQFLAFSIRLHIKAEDIDQARSQLQKLERIESDSPRTLELKAALIPQP